MKFVTEDDVVFPIPTLKPGRDEVRPVSATIEVTCRDPCTRVDSFDNLTLRSRRSRSPPNVFVADPPNRFQALTVSFVLLDTPSATAKAAL